MSNRPINQFVLGGYNDPLSLDNIDEQIQKMVELKKRMYGMNQKVETSPIWDSIDNEVNMLTLDQQERLKVNNVYAELNDRLNLMVSKSLLSLVKGNIESTEEGKSLLQRILEVVRKLKDQVIRESSIEMDLFRSFKDYSTTHPNVTYEEFLKSNIKTENTNGIETSDNGGIA